MVRRSHTRTNTKTQALRVLGTRRSGQNGRLQKSRAYRKKGLPFGLWNELQIVIDRDLGRDDVAHTPALRMWHGNPGNPQSRVFTSLLRSLLVAHHFPLFGHV
jgi:hypothetical protein